MDDYWIPLACFVGAVFCIWPGLESCEKIAVEASPFTMETSPARVRWLAAHVLFHGIEFRDPADGFFGDGGAL